HDHALALPDALPIYLDSERFTAEQIHFVNLIVDELTRNGHMAPGRLFESPYTDTAPTGPIDLFPAPDVEVLTDILDRVRANASRSEEHTSELQSRFD